MRLVRSCPTFSNPASFRLKAYFYFEPPPQHSAVELFGIAKLSIYNNYDIKLIISFVSISLQLPGKKYAPGYNTDMGDKNVWLK